MESCPLCKKKDAPFNRRENKVEQKFEKGTKKTIKPVAKDTNKTRRKIVRAGVLKKTHK